MHCSVAQALEVIGEWWTLLILRDAFLGVTRFDDFAKRLGIARNVLTTRLDCLVESGVLTKVCYEDARNRCDYQLTPKGLGLMPVITAIRQWGDEWIMGEGKEPLALEHTTCGTTVRGVLTCSHCNEELTTRTLRVIPGPGALPDDELIPGIASRPS